MRMPDRYWIGWVSPQTIVWTGTCMKHRYLSSPSGDNALLTKLMVGMLTPASSVDWDCDYTLAWKFNGRSQSRPNSTKFIRHIIYLFIHLFSYKFTHIHLQSSFLHSSLLSVLSFLLSCYLSFLPPFCLTYSSHSFNKSFILHSFCMHIVSPPSGLHTQLIANFCI